MFLSDLSLKRPVLAVVALVALMAVGFMSFLNLNVNDWPDIEFPYVSVTIVRPGASAEQMENDVAIKLEKAMGQVSGVKHIHARVQEGVASVWAEFTLETNPQVAAQDVRDKLGTIRGELPQDIEEPIIARFEPASQPILTLAVTGDKSVRELSMVVEDVVKKRLESVSGVGAVNVVGNEEREVQILLDKNLINAYGISPHEVVASLSGENLEIPAGSLKSAENKISLRTAGKISRVEEYLQLPVARRSGVQIYLKDIARVLDGIKEKEEAARYQGKPVVAIELVKQSGSNTVQVADEIKRSLSAITKEIPPGVSLEIVRDNSLNIRNSVNDVLRTLLEGSLLAVLTVFLFLRNTRSTIISALAIPSSIIVTFSAMKVMGFTLNNMSLMALSLSVGLLIDDAIVVIENIIRHLHMGKTPLEAAREATAEIGLAVMATTFTVVAVFIPVGMMTGEVGQFFKQFGITVAFSVVISLLVSFTLTPVLAARFLGGEAEITSGRLGRFLTRFNELFESLTRFYVKVLDLALAHRIKTLAVALVLFLGTMLIVPFMGSSFVPTSDLGEVSIISELDSGMTLDAALQVAQKAENILRGYPEVVKVYSTTSEDQVAFYIKTVDKGERQQSLKELMARIRKDLLKVPGFKAAMLYNNGIVEEKEWEFQLQGDDLDELQTYAEQAQRIMESIPGAVDVNTSTKPGKPEVKLGIKHQEAADLGVSTAQIAETMNILFTGRLVGRFEEGDDSFDVRVRLADVDRKEFKDLNHIFLISAYESPVTGKQPQITLSQVAEPVFSSSPAVIKRFDRTRVVSLSGNTDGISLGELNQQFLQRVNNEIKLPPGYRFYAGGDSERMDDTFSAMAMALTLGILFIFLILAAQFESYIDPFSIMLSLPMAAIGAILGLLIMGQNLNLVSMIGIIMLMGLVTKNAILLIDFAKKAIASGAEKNQALKQAASIRLRPILMTSTAMILGMIPLALNLGAGSEQRAPMADAAIGGLITSTMLTLLVVPVIYSLLDDLRLLVKKRRGCRSDSDLHTAPEDQSM